ncbi:hypothetical protein ACFQ34_33810 [Pseudonocardia benzenivorans]|uniref:Uncharacterized protein n=1 Tax=Pseudonocardia benzenivorans TaxID=228005 RepID=A0ABW3VW40_9PSEU
MKWTKAGDAEIERWIEDQEERRYDDDAMDRIQDRYEASLGWDVD